MKDLIKAGGFTAEQAPAIETSLASLCGVFEWELGALRYYAGAQQLGEQLNDVSNLSAKLAKVLRLEPVRHALMCEHVRNGDSTDKSSCLERAKHFDQSVDGVLALLHRTAKAAQNAHDLDVERRQTEGRSPLPKDPAAKPEIDALVASIMHEWRELGRSDSDRGRTAFAQRILEWILDKEMFLETVRSQIRRVKEPVSAKIDD